MLTRLAIGLCGLMLCAAGCASGSTPESSTTDQTGGDASPAELVRLCVAQGSFDYVPNIPSFAPSVERQIQLNETVSLEQFIAEYGFGISPLVELDFLETGVLAFVELVLGPPSTEARSDVVGFA